MRKHNNLSGQVFGKLRVLGRVPAGYIDNHLRFLCLCMCGHQSTPRGSSLRSGNTTSCGCTKGNRKHGLKGTPEYDAWTHMVNRCENPNNKQFADYGGRGIGVCLGLRKSVVNLIKAIGLRPDKASSIDRIDNDASYTCGDFECDDCMRNGNPCNIRWATSQQQARNRRTTLWIKFDDEMRPLVEVAAEHGLKGNTLRDRLVAGWPLERALSEPVKAYKPRTKPDG